MIRILQLTDLHLLEDRHGRLKGIPTHDSLDDVLRFIESEPIDFDHLIVTGDVSHDGGSESYGRARELLGPFLTDGHLIPGNHDLRAGMRATWPDAFETAEGPIIFSRESAGWRLIGLDTLIEGEVAGRIDPDQLDWLSRELTDHADQLTVLFMHHPPVSVNCEWLDEIGLEQPALFAGLIADNPQLRLICTGHVHFEFEGLLGECVVATSPSTSVQFEPSGGEPKYVAVPPGFRLIELDGNEFRTRIVRLPQVKYRPIVEDA